MALANKEYKADKDDSQSRYQSKVNISSTGAMSVDSSELLRTDEVKEQIDSLIELQKSGLLQVE